MSNGHLFSNSSAGSRWRVCVRRVVVCEAGAAILFFGSLIHHPELTRSGNAAISELTTLGYSTPTIASPVRVYPAKTEGSMHSTLAGGWHPGVISLRENPVGDLGPEIYLRHELMHEASYRSCSGRIPLWAEEASAMHFSGELALQPASVMPAEAAIDHLQAKIRIGSSLDAASYTALAQLVAVYGWPNSPCAVSEEIKTRVTAPANSDFSFMLIHLLSGRVLETHGDLDSAYPPGSLLKIPYAASLSEASNEAIGEELARSDTVRLLRRKEALDLDRFRFLTSMVNTSSLGRERGSGDRATTDEHVDRTYLGERNRDGNFPFEADLYELSQVLRASLLLEPERFSGLAANGFLPESTLYAANDAHKKILKKMRALCKTGTVSDQRGTPIVGHIMVAWPQEDPLFLAVFRRQGVSGATTFRAAARMLQQWSSRYTAGFGQVKVRLLTLTPRSSWDVVEECDSRERQEPDGTLLQFSSCGWFKILSTARGSRSERYVRGVLQSDPNRDQVIFKTDPETYTDAVLAAEAQDLRGEAAKAMRAVIFWNGVHGSHRHPESTSLCDTTHCMVFRGSTSVTTREQRSSTDPVLLHQLDQLARKGKTNWLPFSEGGVEQWQRRIEVAEMRQVVGESAILALRRERLRNGETVVHLIYPESEEQVSCELFRAKLKLPSCPEIIEYGQDDAAWYFRGTGKGHGLGLSVDTARHLGRSRYSAAAIIDNAYRKTVAPQ